jgi:hypothetical protein
LGQWFIDRGNDERAKFWLWKSPGSHGALILATLYAKSRSARATTRAKDCLSRAEAGLRQLGTPEREALARSKTEFSVRNPDVIWAPNNYKYLTAEAIAIVRARRNRKNRARRNRKKASGNRGDTTG